MVVSVGSCGSPRVLAVLLCMASIPCSRILAVYSSPCSIGPGWIFLSWVVVGESGIGTSLVFHIERCWGTEKGLRGVVEYKDGSLEGS